MFQPLLMKLTSLESNPVRNRGYITPTQTKIRFANNFLIPEFQHKVSLKTIKEVRGLKYAEDWQANQTKTLSPVHVHFTFLSHRLRLVILHSMRGKLITLAKVIYYFLYFFDRAS